MDYSVFDEIRHGKWERKEGEPEQAYMERVLTAAFAPGEEKNSILEMLEAEFAGCDAANQTLDAEFPVRDWELNPSGTLQGGLLTSMMDMVMGVMARYYRKSRMTATVQISVSFMKTVPSGARVRIRAKADKIGSRLIFLRTEAYAAGSDEAAAGATATFV